MNPTEIAGLTLLHFIWQGTLVGLAASAALWSHGIEPLPRDTCWRAPP